MLHRWVLIRSGTVLDLERQTFFAEKRRVRIGSVSMEGHNFGLGIFRKTSSARHFVAAQSQPPSRACPSHSHRPGLVNLVVQAPQFIDAFGPVSPMPTASLTRQTLRAGRLVAVANNPEQAA
jgi:hypothetical protein